jgi:hypothetical protein
MLTHDKRGYRFPIAREINHGPGEIGDAELFAYEHINIFGPSFTCDVLAGMHPIRKTEKYNRDRLNLSYNSDNLWYDGHRYGPVLDRPEEQLDKKRGSEERHPPKQGQMMVHDINGQTRAVLRRAGRYHRIRHGGWWEHKLGNSRIGWGLFLGAREDNLPFTPQDHLVKEKLGVIVPYITRDGSEIDDQFYVPDNLMRFDRALIPEMDFGNEVGRPGERSQVEDEEALYRKRKTYDRMIRQQHGLISTGLYKSVYRLDGALLAPFYTTSLRTLNLVKDIVHELTDGAGFNWLLLKYIPRDLLLSPFNHPKPLTDIVWREPYERVGNLPFYLNNPDRQ